MSIPEIVLGQVGIDEIYEQLPSPPAPVTSGLLPLIPVQVLVAFQNLPTDNPGQITSVASPAGTLGAANVWTDITQFVQGYQTSRGRQHELTQFESGTVQIGLNNQDGRFYSWNQSGPYYGFLQPRLLVQIRTTWQGVTYNRFTGHIDTWQAVWDDPVSSFMAMHVSDAFRLFQSADLTSGGYPAQVISDGAVGYWRCNDVVGSTSAADSSGGGHAGFIAPGGFPFPTFGQTGALPADPATSALFTAVGNATTGLDAAFDTVNDIVPNTATAATAEFWFNGNSSSSSIDNTGVEMFFHFGASQYGVYLAVEGPTSPGVTGRFGSTTLTVSNNLWDGNWHHIVGTMSQSAGCAVYIDGVSVASTATAPTTALGFPFGNAFSGAESPGALMQEVALYPTALTAAQVANHFALAAWTQQTTDQRIAHALNTINWSAGARNLDTGVATVQALTTTLVTTSALSHMQDCEATEAGALYMDVSGNVRFISRQDRVAGAMFAQSQCTFGDNVQGSLLNGQDTPFDAQPMLTLDDIDLYNEARGQRQNGFVQVADNNPSITSYGRSTWQPSGNLIGISDADVLAQCQYIVNRKSTPYPRFQTITVNMLELMEYNQIGPVLALELLWKVTVERLGIPGTGFAQQYYVEHIQETVSPDSWLMVFGMEVADTNQYWVLGQSQLGNSTELYF